jgi:putative aldouronate transport system substrate-binding protein
VEEATVAEEPDSAEAPAEEAEDEGGVAALTSEIVRTYTEAEAMPLVDEPVTLTAWDYLVPPVMAAITDYGTDGLVYSTLQERTGVTLKFTTANLMTASTDMSLMIAANDLPDIIYDFKMFNDSNADDLVEGDIIVDYTEYEDVMPNYFDILNNNPNIAVEIYTDGGAVCYAENIQATLVPSSGPVIRQDWLDADGLDTPVTIDDLHEVLLTFKSENDCQYPFWIAANGNSSLNSAFGVSVAGDNNNLGGWIYEDGQMEYCLPMDGFKEYIQLLADWYSEGLISPDFMSQQQNDTASDDAIVGNGCGFFSSSINGMTNLSGYEPDSDVQPVSRMVLNEGDLNAFDDEGTSRLGKGGAAVAGTCSDIELACRIIDYLYSDEGILLANYGVEGESFEYDENGDMVFTDVVLNNPDYAFGVALIKYTSASPASVCINERNNLGYNDAQMKALDLWVRDTDSIQAPGSIWDTDAQNEYSAIANDLGSFVSTNCLQFITGSKSMDDWDAFVEEALSSFDVDRMTELSQEAVEAYLAKVDSL